MGLDPDFVTIGKTLGAGIASGAYGMSEHVSQLVYDHTDWKNADVGGVGGTLAGNAYLSLAAMRATLGRVMTDDAFDRMIELGERFEQGVRDVIESRELPWHVVPPRVPGGVPVPSGRGPQRGRGGGRPGRRRRSRTSTCYLLNRGILMTPFHNMALMSPATTEAHVDRHAEVFAEAAGELTGRS